MKIPFIWLYNNSKDRKTELFLKRLKKGTIIKQKFPLKLGEFNIWVNDEGQLKSLQTYSEIFKDKDHTAVPNFPSKKDEVIIDLGANEGFYTLKANEKSPNSKIISVEPNPYAFQILKKNVSSNKLKNVTLLNKAVTSKNARIIFEIVKGRTTVGSTKVYEKYRDKEKLRKIKIDSITLEKLCRKYNIRSIDLLKIDVEGSEFDILKSSKNILPKIKKIVVEYHNAQKTKEKVKRILSKNGFKMLLDDKEKYYGEFYFIRKE
jgi:FkbM family methyltransferase